MIWSDYQVPVVHTLDGAIDIHRINHYPVDNNKETKFGQSTG